MSTETDLTAPIKVFGSATFSRGDNVAADVKCDRLACDGNTLMMIGLVAEPVRIKAIRAILHGNGKPFVKVSKCFVKYPSGGDLARRTPGILETDKAGYETFASRLDYGITHVLFVSKSEDFIRHLSPAAIWRKLNISRFTTPMLETWMPYITARLIEEKHLRECGCFRCNCGVLDAIAEDKLDALVGEGVRSGALIIP